MTRYRDWLGSVVPEASKTSYARMDSYWDPPLSVETAFSEAVPPAARLATKRPIVATNQRVKTGQRCRALQSATRTVQGWRWGVPETIG